MNFHSPARSPRAGRVDAGEGAGRVGPAERQVVPVGRRGAEGLHCAEVPGPTRVPLRERETSPSAISLAVLQILPEGVEN